MQTTLDIIKNSIISENYKNWQDIHAEFVLARSNFIENVSKKGTSKENTPFLRLVSFFYNDLCQIVEHPIYTKKGIAEWKYTCFEDKEDVAQIVLLAFRSVVFDVAEDKDTISDRTLKAIRSTIYYRVRNKATSEIYHALQIPVHPKFDENGEKYYERIIEYVSNDRLFELVKQFYYNGSRRIIRKEKKVVFDTEKRNIYPTPEALVLKKEKNKIITDVIAKFLKNRDKLDTAIFLNHILAKAQYGDFRFNKFSPEQIAIMNNVHVRTVFKRKKKLLQEFKEVWEKEVQPYLLSA